MELTYFQFDRNYNFVDLYFDNGTSLRVKFNALTGKIYKRPKIHSVLRHLIDHKGIYIGTSSNGTHILVHNHISPGRAVLVTWDEFAENEKVSLDNKVCSNNPIQMVSIALQKVIDREPYDAINYSCQTLTNMTCNNQRKNDDTERVIGGVLVSVALVAIIGGLFGD